MGDLVIIFIFFNTFVRYLLVFKWVSKFPQNSREVWAIWEECVRYSGGLNKLRCAEKIRFGKQLNGNIRQRCTCLHNCTMYNCTMHMHHSPPNATSFCSSLHDIFNWTRFVRFVTNHNVALYISQSKLVSGRTLTHFNRFDDIVITR